VVLVEEATTYVSVQAATSREHHDAFLDAVGRAADQSVGTTVSAGLTPLLADAQGLLGTAEVDEGGDAMATFLSMPLRAGGRTLGLLAMSSAAPNAFGESALTTLRLVAGPAAVVIAHAKLAAVPVG
jgi:GAF domain-containing protein